jgi:hypothetical protein
LWYELPRVHSLTVTRVEQTNPQKTGSLAGKGISPFQQEILFSEDLFAQPS